MILIFNQSINVMRNLKIYLVLVLINLTSLSVYPQEESNSEAVDKSVKATNFTVPSSVAFNLLEITPSQVHRPGFSKDFKFDWLIKDNKVASNFAVEMQPLWLFFYENTDYNALSKQKTLERALSSLSISIGTSSKENIRSLAWGAKFNLYSAKNPLYDTSYINKIGDFFTKSKLEDEYLAKQMECDNSNLDQSKKEACQKELEKLKIEYDKEIESHLNKIEKYKEQYEKTNWNTTIIDLGFGKIYNYLSESIDSLSFIDQGGGVWLSANFGLGKKGLINGMVKYSEISEINTTVIGANFRYGSLNTNFFIEGLYNSTSKESLKKISIAYGGDIKFKAFALQFGLRTDYDNNFNFKNLIPVVNFNYLLD
ncbi:MAG: hypothetical protein IPP38_08230 [Bacteroidetes bacterium]|nr:hypothetical protein [Bacteroidota bacterium]